MKIFLICLYILDTLGDLGFGLNRLLGFRILYFQCILSVKGC